MDSRAGDRRCAFLTMDEAAGPESAADPAMAALALLGWVCERHNWRNDTADWNRFAAVYVAATYDYPTEPDRFLDMLAAVDRSAATLVNPLSLIRWNVPKTYLRGLEKSGVRIVPSRWYANFSGCDLAGDATRLNAGTLIVKPVVSTNATDTFLVDVADADRHAQPLSRAFADRPFMVQPFVNSIREHGEFSLFYFGGCYSHAIQKLPEPSDFRVQEEHGGHVVPYSPDADLMAAAEQLLGVLPIVPVYARCDYVRGNSGRYELMELELIEPSLYLETDEGAAGRFARAFERYVTAQGESQ